MSGRRTSARSLALLWHARSVRLGRSTLFGLDRGTPIVFHCHHGIRTQEAAQQLLREGFRNVYNLEGGIDAWSRNIDPTVARY